MTICVAGKSNISTEILDYLLSHYSDFEYIACCNQNDFGEDGFQKSFKKFCKLKGVKVLPLSEIYNYDNLLFLSLEFDKIIDPNKFKSARLYNIHFSLLPSYKGMYTSILPILHNETFSGVTLHEIDKGIDTGNIIAQKRFRIGPNTNGQQLYEKYIAFGIRLIKDNLDTLIENKIISYIQTAINASYFSKKAIDFSNIHIDLNKTAQEIHNQIRGFAFQAYQLPEVYKHRIYKSSIIFNKTTGKSGSIHFEDDFHLLINTVDYQVKLFKHRIEELIDFSTKGELQRIIHFLENGYNIRQRTAEGWDILIIAGYNGHFEVVKFLIGKLQWDANTCNNNGTSFAMYVMTNASKSKKYDLLKYVLTLKNINWSHKDYAGKDIFEYARFYKNDEVIKLIETKQ